MCAGKGKGLLGLAAPPPGSENQVGERPSQWLCFSHGVFEKWRGNWVLW